MGYDETGRRPNRPPIAGSGRLLFPTAGAAGGARLVYTAAAVLYTHYTASTNYLPLMSSQLMNIFMYFYLSCTIYSTVLSRTMSTLCTVGYYIFYILMLYNNVY